MDGDDVVRRCHDCERDVVNLSALDEATAATLLRERSATACVRYDHQRGKVVFAKRVGRLAVAAAAAVLIGSAPAGADTTTPPTPTPKPAPRHHKRGDDKKRPAPPKKHDATDDGAEGGVLVPNF
jgi:hypothetical protein